MKDIPGIDEDGNPKTRRMTRANSKFDIQTIDELIRRVLIASSCTTSGGDAYFVVRDLFGGEGISVIPSLESGSSGGIQINVKVSRIEIICNNRFDIYDTKTFEEAEERGEPLIQLKSKMKEVLQLECVRSGVENVVVLREKKKLGNEKARGRTLTIKPAKYTKK